MQVAKQAQRLLAGRPIWACGQTKETFLHNKILILEFKKINIV
jgi:hypothetical protein